MSMLSVTSRWRLPKMHLPSMHIEKTNDFIGHSTELLGRAKGKAKEKARQIAVTTAYRACDFLDLAAEEIRALERGRTEYLKHAFDTTRPYDRSRIIRRRWVKASCRVVGYGSVGIIAAGLQTGGISEAFLYSEVVTQALYLSVRRHHRTPRP